VLELVGIFGCSRQFGRKRLGGN